MMTTPSMVVREKCESNIGQCSNEQLIDISEILMIPFEKWSNAMNERYSLISAIIDAMSENISNEDLLKFTKIVQLIVLSSKENKESDLDEIKFFNRKLSVAEKAYINNATMKFFDEVGQVFKNKHGEEMVESIIVSSIEITKKEYLNIKLNKVSPYNRSSENLRAIYLFKRLFPMFRSIDMELQTELSKGRQGRSKSEIIYPSFMEYQLLIKK